MIISRKAFEKALEEERIGRLEQRTGGTVDKSNLCSPIKG